MLLTEAHKKRNEDMKDRAKNVSALRPRTVAEALEQYDRIIRTSSRVGWRRTRAEKGPPGPREP